MLKQSTTNSPKPNSTRIIQIQALFFYVQNSSIIHKKPNKILQRNTINHSTKYKKPKLSLHKR